ncbi:metalloregulator ArsR/SmtB family transcription factor [Halomonas sp. NO4]|uniref:ArsR/SmtB family transcription factor n=1 Tax=Halomonas sp. NO4 TaxID=2484813 RepID=UPI0013D173DB|nr:metalloregulator ArsR/SmtB family transcription factor [Halomonas sp. NO4]
MTTSKHDLYEQLAQLGRALGHANRLELLELLAQAEYPVDALAEAAGISVANASQHLQQLRRAGLVTARREGRQMRYALTDERIVTLLGLLGEVARGHLAEVERLMGRLFADEDADGALEPISREALAERLASGEVTLLDVRPTAEYRTGHLPGALNLPLEDLEARLARLPQDQEVVAYCRGPYCVMSHEAVKLLRRHGFRVRRFEEGYPEWKAAGLPVES